MLRIGLISDTHSYVDTKVAKHFSDCDEIWHAGDFGNIEVVKNLEKIKPLTRGVYGNIDGAEIRILFPEHLIFKAEGLKIYMTHIGGYPGKYITRAKDLIKKEKPDIFICGHSHILRVMRDPDFNNMIVMNPGAAGKEGFHRVKTLLKFELNNGKIENLSAIELGPRGSLE
jgi:putative phosphoesterase